MSIQATLAASAASASPTPIAAYSFDEGSGSTLTDSAGNHDGTISGATWTSTGKYGSALDFDGTDDLVTVADAADLDLTRTFTLEAWVRPDTVGNLQPVLNKVSASPLSGYMLSAANTSGLPNGWVLDSGATKTTTGPSALPTDGTWSHLAFSSDGSTLRLYLNGAEVATNTSAVAAGANGADLLIGRNAVTGGWFNGMIDEVRVYGETLGQSQIEVDKDNRVQAPALREVTTSARWTPAPLRRESQACRSRVGETPESSTRWRFPRSPPTRSCAPLPTSR